MATPHDTEHGPSAEAIAANEAGKRHVGDGRREEARACFAQAVDRDPGFAEAHNNLANALAEAGDPDAAIRHYQRAVTLRPHYAEAQFNLGNAHKARDGDAAALPAYRAAAELRPDFVEAHYTLAGCLHRLDRPAEAAAAYRRVVALRPDAAEAHNNLGAVLRQLGDRDGALAALDRACLLQPGYAIAQANRGSVLADLRCHEAAIGAMLHALGLDPANHEILAQLCNLLRGLHRIPQAIAVCRAFAGQNPDAAAGHVMLAELLRDAGELDAAEEAARRALALVPDLATAHMVAGNIRSDQGDLDGALAGYRRALELNPNDRGAHNSLLFMMQFAAGVTAEAILAEARRWAALHEAPLLAQARDRPPAPARPRGALPTIGYVSPYFRRHSAAAFLLPLLAHHDPARVRVICYADIRRPDAVTERLRGLGHLWRDITCFTDAELAEQVRADGVDVLVDTALHMEGSRLPAFARRPAPTQVTWLGYPGTTGLASIDYRLTDPLLDPVGGAEPYAEATARLPKTFWCYAPMIEAPAVSGLPALARAHLTFGCFNNFRKVTPETLALWADVLTALPTARLHLLCEPGRHRERVLERLREAGVAGERIRFIGRQPLDAYYALYREIDIALDTTPYAGHTTTLDSLWMGVPVVSLCGPTVVGRGGLSILTNAGLPEWVAADRWDFVARVLRLGTDLDRLAALRGTLRARMQASPLMDAPAFARAMEDTLIRLASRERARSAHGLQA